MHQKHRQGKPLNRNSHSINIESNGILKELVDKFSTNNEILVNSHHHQAVKSTGENLVVTAKAKDGVIECIEDIDREKFIIGVQWHPELSWKEDKLSYALFKKFVDCCSL